MAALTCSEFTSYIVSQEPIYSDLILSDVRPTDGEIGHFEVGTWPAFSGTTQYQDRFHHVFPNTTKQWVAKTTGANGTCASPCDKTFHEIGWGNSRESYYQEEINYQTPLICYDNEIPRTHAREHFAQIFEKVLRPATNAIVSNWVRKRAADHAGKKWVADAAMTDFTFTWGTTGDEEDHIFTTQLPTSKLTPQMLQRRFYPLMLSGYHGAQPFKDMPQKIELVTDMETCWELDKAVADSNVNGAWRFQDWGASNQYYAYGWTGQLGNYVVRVDPTPLRFLYAGLQQGGTHRFNVVQPYENVAADNGQKSQVNDDYVNAQYQFSRIWHRRAVMVLVASMQPIHSEMPFVVRDLSGKWKWVMDNLGAGTNGCVIENKLRNKGQWVAEFNFAWKPQYVEYTDLIFHKREPACITELYVCNSDLIDGQSSYPTQDYSSDDYHCETELA